jgi:hypothetical protein
MLNLNSLLVFRPLLLSSCIFTEDERSTTVCKSIIDTLNEKALLLDQWAEKHEAMFGASHDIPPRESIHLSKLQDGVITTDTCNAARLLSSMIAEKVEEAVQVKISEEGGDAASATINAYCQDCHNHLRNVWIGAMTKRLSTYLNEVLASDLSGMYFRHRVSTMFDSVLRAVDKEFSLPANYPKGHGDLFLHWLKLNHPGAILVPVQRTAGSRQNWPQKGLLLCFGIGGVLWLSVSVHKVSSHKYTHLTHLQVLH